MKRWACVEGGVVSNVVEQEDTPQIEGVWVECVPEVGPWHKYANGVFTAPPPPPPLPRIITKLAFRFRLTDLEYVGILSASKTDVSVEAWVSTFNMVSQINLADQRTAAGVDLLVSKGLLSQERADAILNKKIDFSELP